MGVRCGLAARQCILAGTFSHLSAPVDGGNNFSAHFLNRLATASGRAATGTRPETAGKGVFFPTSYWERLIGSVLLGASYWERLIGSVLLGASYWERLIGSVLLGASYWEHLIEDVLRDGRIREASD